MRTSIQIGNRTIGPDHSLFIVAEISANHCGSYEGAVELLMRAHQSGADAVKLQTYTADTITIRSNRPEFCIKGGTLWDGRTLHDLYEEAHTPWDWQPKLKRIADGLGIPLFSSPFDQTAVEFLEQMNVPVYKVASPELVDFPLIEKMARTGKPLIMSTGMATIGEIDDAVQVAQRAGAAGIALLKCTSAYPSPPEEINLACIQHLAESFQLPVGLSDHTLGIAVPVAAVALGACIIEKHLTLARVDGGPDAAFSLEPDEFAEMVRQVRIAEAAIGAVRYGPTKKECASLVARRSLYVVQDVGAGEQFTGVNVRSIRPGNGLHPRHLGEILGRTARTDIGRGTPMAWSLIGE